MQIRCLLEGVGVDDMLENWDTLLPDYMQRWELDRAEVRPGASASARGRSLSGRQGR